MNTPDPRSNESDADAFARSIAEQAKRDSENAMGIGRQSSHQSPHQSSQSDPGDSDRPARPGLRNTLEDWPRPTSATMPSDPDAMARLIAERARRESESYIGKSNTAGDRLWLYLIFTPGIGMALSPWILVRSRSTVRQRQASRFALGVGIVWLAMTMLSAGSSEIGPLTSLNSATTWIYVFLMLSQMVRVWQRKSLPIKR